MNRPYAAKLHELLQSSFNLPNAVVDLGRIELGPSEIKDVTQQICQRNRSNQSGIDAKAHYLLAASGFNAEQVLSDIAQISFAQREPVDPAGFDQSKPPSKTRPLSTVLTTVPSATDLTKQIQTNKTASSLKPDLETKLTSLVNSDFDEFLGKQLELDWTTRKREIFELLGSDSNGKPQNMKAPWRNERRGRQVLGKLGATESAQFTPVMRAYGEVVTELCNNDLTMPDIVDKFAKALNNLGPAALHPDSGYLQDSWRALQIGNPQKFLEAQYRDYIDAEIKRHRQDARLGGVPSSYAKIKAFVALKYRRMSSSYRFDGQNVADAHQSASSQWDPRLQLVNKTPIWAYLYYLVRAGHLEEAQQVVLERKDIFETLGSSFALFFQAWAESPQHTLSAHYTEMIHAEFHQLSRQAVNADPYKMALYKIIGRCDLFKRTLPSVAVTTEDWLWLQLVLSSEGSAYTFEDVQKYVQNIGAEHLSAGIPAKYFTILVVLKLYPEAIQYLQTYNETYAVHFAIALLVKQLAFNQLVAANDQLITKPRFSELLGRYTRFFRSLNPALAVDYLAVVAGAAKQLDDSHEALQELVLETGKYTLLLGDVQTFSEHPITGCVENRQRLLGLEDRRKYLSIARGAAAKARADGRVVDAILLYRLAEEPHKVLDLVNSQLGLMLSGVQLGQPVSAGLSPSFDILQLARNVMRIDGDVLAKTPGSRDTCLVLLAIAECLDLLAKREWQPCLERLTQTGLLVLSPEPAVSQVRELAQQFLSYDESIARNVPNVLLMALTCIINISGSLKKQGPSVATRMIDQYRGRANNCMVYAGLIQFRMPREVYANLTRMEAELIA